MGWDKESKGEGSNHAEPGVGEPRIELCRFGTLTQRCDRLARTEVDADWLSRITTLVDSLPLLDSSADSGLGEALLAAAAAPSITLGGFVPGSADASPAGVQAAAQGLAQLVGQLDRVMAWAGAHQAAAMAALGRPGVAVPMGDLLDTVTHGGSGGPIGVGSAEALRSNDYEAPGWQDVSVCGDPAWDDAAADHAQRIAAAEVGARLAWTPATARTRMFESTDIVDALPLAHRLWAQGRLDRARVIAIADRTHDLDAAARALVEEQLLSDGGALLSSKTSARVRVLVDRCAAALDPDAIRRRQERARQDRDVYVSPREDGISRFCADVPTPVAILATSIIDHVAQGLPSDRTIGQRRADVFADLFTRLAAHGHIDLRGNTPPDAAQQPVASEPAAAEDLSALLPAEWEQIDSGVTVVIDAATLDRIDLQDLPAIEGALLGSHPALPADLVNALALSARRARIAIRGTAGDGITSCQYGCASTATNLTLGADVYRPSAKLIDQVVLRDRTCRFPGCRHPARTCDLDHRRPFVEGGPTTAENLDALCRFHHRLKTFTGRSTNGISTPSSLDHRQGWRTIRQSDNQLSWTTPLGAVITDEPDLPPPPVVRPRAVDPPPF